MSDTSPSHRWSPRLRFGLRALLVFIAIVAIALGWLRHRAEQQRLAVNWIEEHDGRITYEHYLGRMKPVEVYYSDAEQDRKQWQDRLPKNDWYADLFGEHFFYQIHGISFAEQDLTNEPWRISHAYGVRELYFSECPLNAAALQAIGDCRNLNTLGILDCRCDLTSLSHLTRLKALKTLYLRNVTLDRASLAIIGKCEQLEELELLYCTFDANDFAQLKPLRNLTFLGLMFTSVGDEQLLSLKDFTNLRRLELGRKVTDAGLDQLAGLNNLEDLIFAESAVTDAAIGKVTVLPKLKTLHLSKCRISSGKFAEMMKVRPTLAISYARDPDWPVTR